MLRCVPATEVIFISFVVHYKERLIFSSSNLGRRGGSLGREVFFILVATPPVVEVIFLHCNQNGASEITRMKYFLLHQISLLTAILGNQSQHHSVITTCNNHTSIHNHHSITTGLYTALSLLSARIIRFSSPLSNWLVDIHLLSSWQRYYQSDSSHLIRPTTIQLQKESPSSLYSERYIVITNN